ncbi:MAG: trypsin-like serine protease [Gemmatimonadaceae bacterium]
MSVRRFLPYVFVAAVTVLGCEQTTTSPLTVDVPSLITNGDPDGEAHPAVVLIIMEVNGSPAFRCTGTLLSERVVLTAGHCTGEPGEFSGMRIFTESNVQNGNNNYPFAGPNTVEAEAWYAHPQYSNSAFFLHDVGVIELKESVSLAANQYGTLPTVNQLDALKPRASNTFTAVGYGLQRINPAKVVAQKVRMFATPHLVQINTGFTGSFSLLLSNNASTGGTCFGDSGGPNYLGTSNVVAGVTSFGLNGSCGGTGGVFRMDRLDVLTFVRGFLLP